MGLYPRESDSHEKDDMYNIQHGHTCHPVTVFAGGAIEAPSTNSCRRTNFGPF